MALSNKQIFLLFLMGALVLGATLFVPLSAASAPAISEAQWEQLTQDETFGYRTEKELGKARSDIPANNVLTRLIASIFMFFSSPAGRTVIWSILFLMLGYTLYRIFIKNLVRPKAEKPKEKEEVKTALLPEDLLAINWEDQLQKAVRENDFRLAIRFSYMRLLQLLQERHLIQYRTDKTNHDYYYELDNGKIKQPFRQISRQYEYAWYGNYAVQDVMFKEYMNTFNDLKKQLSK